MPHYFLILREPRIKLRINKAQLKSHDFFQWRYSEFKLFIFQFKKKKKKTLLKKL